MNALVVARAASATSLIGITAASFLLDSLDWWGTASIWILIGFVLLLAVAEAAKLILARAETERRGQELEAVEHKFQSLLFDLVERKVQAVVRLDPVGSSAGNAVDWRIDIYSSTGLDIASAQPNLSKLTSVGSMGHRLSEPPLNTRRSPIPTASQSSEGDTSEGTRAALEMRSWSKSERVPIFFCLTYKLLENVGQVGLLPIGFEMQKVVRDDSVVADLCVGLQFVRQLR